MAVTIKSAHEIELMRESCRLLSLVFDGMEKMIKPGITTAEINQLGDRLIREYGGIPNFLNYDGYPASICVSVNDEVVHGIPSDKRVLQEGDIVSLDAGLIYEGYHSDAARTYPVGNISKEAADLFEVTRTIAGNGDTEWSDSLWATESVHTFMRIHRFPITISGEEELSFVRG